ncbi:maleylpyruvate isomerase family mycothiol-dependent enzyme [Nocardioides sp. zg-579]|uniref:Maleylpyruvate isomerase family mycothiol-dependent enzyme n=1 Tax=Nocardioides marmotae TaxID=2663857 RepID=A0A6I3JGY7_9ACTN|nr:maleylpyruvate isomerase family mycothiol-dependent enzyme [Nocardioides marmotae]MCR6033682.1 maleylpyruvate isomerase family mycothiol-dependent enzyme [Gordonia jinghuaiqii]MTB97340.1 maleylpyruvate isomerase family mycothiol-dependent enzyme [Nocardioides marmotae]QKE01685.1 maleylpyruvate isomerase family mycothiol-dependent enzyme [Nocardioides marmotae]
MPDAALGLPYPVYLDHIRGESRRFREVLATCDPAARVPSCPDWTAADLLWHLAEVQGFWARIVRERPSPPDEDSPGPERPATYEGLLAAFDEQSAALVAELEAAGPDAAAWHWAPVRTVGTSYRRQAHEALIHRLDAEQAAGAETPLDPALAADGVLELVDVMYGGEAPAWGRFEPSAHLVRLDLLDRGASILLRPGTFTGTEPESRRTFDGPHVQVVAREAAAGDGSSASAVVAGTAEDLDAWLWQRRDDSRITVTGDPAAYDAFRAAVTQPLD